MANTKRFHASEEKVFTPIPLDEDKDYNISVDYILWDDSIDYLHYHNLLEIGFCQQGCGIFNINNHTLDFEGRSVVVIPPGQYHLASSLKNTKSTWIWVYLKAQDSLLKLNSARYHWVQEPLLCDELHRLCRESKEENLPEREKRLQGRLQIIGSELLRIQQNELNPLGEFKAGFSPVISRAIQIIHQRYWQGLSVEELAECCNMSPSGFYRLFKREFAISPKKYLSRYRVRMACGALKTQRNSMEYLADTLGFGSLSSFNRCFKGETGYAPRDWLKVGKGIS
ncbi:MAG: AraC family transcriptional regulator [Spirochaetaceae bacterium]|nr:AraC family transcriptional regulator [Spirochaetaceae bacterium]